MSQASRVWQGNISTVERSGQWPQDTLAWERRRDNKAKYSVLQHNLIYDLRPMAEELWASSKLISISYESLR